ncbi:MAG: beta-ketoacyl-ACP synthase 3 [Solirubrobacteraceae bacterium]|nr:beta-ketoacyl-ACP synthase 3 [Solirubrobacteraceae bacterium]
MAATAPATAATPAVAPAPRRRPTRRAGIFGVGAALPGKVVTNDDLAQRLDTSDEWIVRRTGIRTRHWLDGDEQLAPLAAEACRRALADAGREPDEVDRIIVTTITPDRLTPGLAPTVAGLIGCPTSVVTADLNAACAGFLVALDEAAGAVESGRSDVVLVCAAEALTRITDRDDRSTAVLFGDGAAAVVVAGGDLEGGIGRFVHGTDPSMADALYVGIEERLLRMEGQTVYRHAVARMVEATAASLAASGLTIDDIDLFVAHQANARIIQTAAAELGMPDEKVMIDVDRCANTSSATIPLALERAQREGRLAPGATIALAALGAGFVWSAGVVRWKERAHVCA